MPANKGGGLNDRRSPTEYMLDAFREDLADMDARLAERYRKTTELREERELLRQAVAELERAVSEERAAEVAEQIRRSYE
ncbi:hypothetical protein [Salibacterium lacus]|uniref:Uncharacterized protein n=1 Tax=Salibacterium lacus TaxID=1898109 RepID=A0ABW5SZR1_9BACI